MSTTTHFITQASGETGTVGLITPDGWWEYEVLALDELTASVSSCLVVAVLGADEAVRTQGLSYAALLSARFTPQDLRTARLGATTVINTLVGLWDEEFGVVEASRQGIAEMSRGLVWTLDLAELREEILSHPDVRAAFDEVVVSPEDWPAGQ